MEFIECCPACLQDYPTSRDNICDNCRDLIKIGEAAVAAVTDMRWPHSRDLRKVRWDDLPGSFVALSGLIETELEATNDD